MNSHKRYPVNSLNLIRGFDSKSFLGCVAGRGGLFPSLLTFPSVGDTLCLSGIKSKDRFIRVGPLSSLGVNIDIFSIALAGRLITVLLGLQRRDYPLLCMLTTHESPVMMTSSAVSTLSFLSLLHPKNATGSELR